MDKVGVQLSDPYVKLPGAKQKRLSSNAGPAAAPPGAVAAANRRGCPVFERATSRQLGGLADGRVRPWHAREAAGPTPPPQKGLGRGPPSARRPNR